MKYEIQKRRITCPIHSEDCCEDVDLTCEGWETFGEYDSAEDAAAHFIACVNSEMLDEMNYYYRLVNLETKKVRGI